MANRDYKALLFDAGDTLVRFAPPLSRILSGRFSAAGVSVSEAEAEAAEAAMHVWTGRQIKREQEGAPRLTDAEWERGMDKVALEHLRGNADDGVLDALSAQPWPAQSVEVIPGTHEALTAFGSAGYTLAVVSNWDPSLPEKLSELGLSEYFACLVVSDIEGVRKPDPRILRIACERLGVAAEDCLYIGDHPYDVLCAHRAGMPAVWLASPAAILPPDAGGPEDLRVASLAELAHLLA